MKDKKEAFFENSAIRLGWMGHQLAKYRNRLLMRYGITQGQSKIIHMLQIEEGKTITQRDIERKFSICPSTVTSMINTLERSGYLMREVDADDARVRKIRLTDKGHACEGFIYQTAQETEEQFLGVLDPEEREQFIRTLQRLSERVREMSEEK